MVIFKADLDTHAHTNAVKKVEELIKKQGGACHSVNRLGRKKLAYEIKKQKEGIYDVFLLRAQPESIKEMDRVLKLDDNVLRFMFVKQPEKVKG